MGERMAKAILFDFWGTLIENGVFPSPVRQVKNILRLYDLPFPQFILQFEKAMMTSKFDNLYKAFEAVCEEFKIRPDQLKLDILVGMWNKNRMLAKPFPETLEVLERLKKTHKLILVSNTDSISVSSVIEKYNLAGYFDSIYLSCDLGQLKSNPLMFEQILEKEALSKEDAIMVGDSIESDLLAAEKAGMKGVLIDRQGRREHPNRVASLAEVEKFL
jgi:HAD superfamily hydrolase (TIGR01549 family)